MPITSIEQVEQLRAGLSSAQKELAFDAYRRARAAHEMAGFPDADCDERASRIALSRIDARQEVVAICDSLYDGEWPRPGKGAPRNPYGGYASVDYPGGSQGWADAWRVYISGIEEAKAFLDVSEWIWALHDALNYQTALWDLPEVDAREGALPDAQVLSTPADHGLKAWQEVPEGESQIRYAAPSESDLQALYCIYQEERKRKEIDSLLDFSPEALRKLFGVEPRVDGRQVRIDAISEFRVVRHDEDTGLLTLDIPIIQFKALPYLDGSGQVVWEAKLAKDFATPAYLSTLPGRPITRLHPTGRVFDGLGVIEEMTPEESAQRTLGLHHKDDRAHWVEDGKVWSRVTLFEPSLVQDVLLHKEREVSVGVLAISVDEEGDDAFGQHYTKRQTQPIHDHTAFVPRGRCGPECAVVLDGAVQAKKSTGGTMTQKNKQDAGTPPAGEPRVLQIVDAADEAQSLSITLCPDVAEDAAKAFQDRIDAILKDRIDAEAKITELNGQVEQLTGAKDGADGEITALRQKVTDLETAQTAFNDGLDERMIALADERAEMITFVEDNMPDDYDYHGKPIAQIKRDALTEHYGEDVLSPIKDKSDEYSNAFVDVRFDALKDELAQPTGPRQVRSTKDGSDNETTDPRQALHRTGKAAAQPTG